MSRKRKEVLKYLKDTENAVNAVLADSQETVYTELKSIKSDHRKALVARKALIAYALTYEDFSILTKYAHYCDKQFSLSFQMIVESFERNRIYLSDLTRFERTLKKALIYYISSNERK